MPATVVARIRTPAAAIILAAFEFEFCTVSYWLWRTVRSKCGVKVAPNFASNYTTIAQPYPYFASDCFRPAKICVGLGNSGEAAFLLTLDDVGVMVKDNLATPAIVSGLVLTLSIDTALADAAIHALRAHPRLTVGEEWGRWVPVSIEADDDRGCRDLHDWISSLKGVVYVDVVAVTFDNDLEAERLTSTRPNLN